MKTLDEFKKTYSNNWKALGYAWKLLLVIYFYDEGKGMYKKDLIRLSELKEKNVEKGLASLLDNQEISFTEDANGKRFSLKQETKKAFERLYSKISE